MADQPFNDLIQNPTEALWGLALTLREGYDVWDGWYLSGMGDGLASMSVDHAGSGPNGLDNPDAWMWFTDNITGEQFVFQRHPATNERWQFLVSKTGSFVGAIGPKHPPIAPTDGILAVDFSMPLLSPGLKTFICGISVYSDSAIWSLAVQDPKLPANTTVISYDFTQEKRIIAHLGDFSAVDKTRRRKVYPALRLPAGRFDG